MGNTEGKRVQGYHLDVAKGEFVHLDGDHQSPNEYAKLVRVPTGILAAAAPVLSVAYVIFLPFTGIVACFAYLGLKIKALGLAIGRLVKHEPAS